MQAFLEYVVKGLVSHPQEVTVTPVVKDTLTVYELRLNPEDVGKIIDRQGMTINAIRSLLMAGSAKKGLRCAMEIVEDNPSGPAGERPERRPRSAGARSHEPRSHEE